MVPSITSNLQNARTSLFYSIWPSGILCEATFFRLGLKHKRKRLQYPTLRCLSDLDNLLKALRGDYAIPSQEYAIYVAISNELRRLKNYEPSHIVCL